MHEGRSEKIRLHGIDAPERGQAFSNRAKQSVSGLFGKEVTVKPRGQDRYRRTVAEVMLLDGRNLNHEVVKAGSLGGSDDMLPMTGNLKSSNLRREKRGEGCGQTRSRCPLGVANAEKGKPLPRRGNKTVAEQDYFACLAITCGAILSFR